MNVLGWQILNEKSDYVLDMPRLSDEEKEIIIKTEERFKEATRSREVNGKQESVSLISTIMIKAAEELGFYLDIDQQEYLSNIAISHIYGFAFVERLIEDQEIEEISIIGPMKPVYVYVRKKGWKKVNACFENEKAIADIINKMSRGVGRHITIQNPRLDAVLPDGSRLHGSLSPISSGEITIRKFRSRPYSPIEIVKNETVSLEAMALLSVLMQCDLSILIAGNTASGKTTTMNGLFSFVPGNERVIITEETPEINIPHEHQLRLVANKEMDITLKDLVYDSLRMRPDRMIVGEVRNKEEVEAFFDVVLAGQARGSYATIHGRSTQEAISRLNSFGIRDLDVQSIDCIIVQRRMLVYDPKKRKNIEIRKVTEIAELDKDGNPHGFYDGNKINSNMLIEKAAQSFGLSDKEMEDEFKQRMRIISKADADYFRFFSAVQEKFYGFGGE